MMDICTVQTIQNKLKFDSIYKKKCWYLSIFFKLTHNTHYLMKKGRSVLRMKYKTFILFAVIHIEMAHDMDY